MNVDQSRQKISKSFSGLKDGYTYYKRNSRITKASSPRLLTVRKNMTTQKSKNNKKIAFCLKTKTTSLKPHRRLY